MGRIGAADDFSDQSVYNTTASLASYHKERGHVAGRRDEWSRRPDTVDDEGGVSGASGRSWLIEHGRSASSSALLDFMKYGTLSSAAPAPAPAPAPPAPAQAPPVHQMITSPSILMATGTMAQSDAAEESVGGESGSWYPSSDRKTTW